MFYTTNKVLPTIEQIQIINLKKFVIVTLDVDNEIFVIYIDIRKQEKILVHSKKQAQVRVLLFNKAPTKVPVEYSDYSDIFLIENVIELSESIGINKYTIKLREDKQPLFGPIYSLGLVKLKTLKIYIKTNLANSFIQSSNFPTGTSILFDKKPNKSLCLYINY